MYFGPLVNDQSVTYLLFLGWNHLAHRSDKTFGFQMHSWWELATNFLTKHVFVEKCWFVKSKCFTDASLLWCIFSELQEGFCFWDLFQIELPWVGKSSRVCLEKWAQRDAIFSILWKWPIWLAQIMWQQCVEFCGARSHWGDIQLLNFRSKVSESWICVFFFPKFENFTFQLNCTPSWEIGGQLCSDQGCSWELFPVPENLEMQLLKTEFPRLKRGINQSIFLVWKTRKNLMFSSFEVLRASGTESLCLSKSQAKNGKLV